MGARPVPVGAPPVVVKFVPENMPKRWAVDVVAKEVKDHDQATASNSPTAAELSEGTLDELTEKLSEKDEKDNKEA